MFGINFNFAAQYNAAKNCGPFLPNRSGSKFSQMPELQKSMPTDSMQKKKTLFFFFFFLVGLVSWCIWLVRSRRTTIP